MRRFSIIRLLILLAAVYLLLAPVLDGIVDPHDQLQGRHADYTESIVCVFAATATAGLWINRAAVARLTSLARRCFPLFLAPLLHLAEVLNPLADLIAASPPCPLRV